MLKVISQNLTKGRKCSPMTTFSQDLINKTIKLFKQEHNHDISEEEADLYLKSFADLYLSVIDLLKHQQSIRSKDPDEIPSTTDSSKK